MRLLVVPDKFKGTLTAHQAAAAIAEGWRRARPGDRIETIPMSDGGDGFGEIIGELIEAAPRDAHTVNAAGEPVSAPWWWSAQTNTAIVESARAIGLAMLPKGKFHPFDLDTAGLGLWLKQIAAEYPGANLVVGIGGSATNDGGFGMAKALGFRFLGPNAEIQRWTQLPELIRITPPNDPPKFSSVTVACDVQNPLLGPEGASRIYGPQKGLRPEDMPAAEASLRRLAEVAARDLGRSAPDDPGAGAAGGLGFGLKTFLNGQFEPGFGIFSRLAKLPQRILAADLVITAEGCIDAQTQMGKGTGAVAGLARELGKKCVGLAGFARERASIFTAVHGIHPDLATLDAAMAEPARLLSELSFEAALDFATS
jgi:glycerate kinase